MEHDEDYFFDEELELKGTDNYIYDPEPTYNWNVEDTDLPIGNIKIGKLISTR